MFKCKYCEKKFETKQQLAGHSTHCKLNPNYDNNKSAAINNITKNVSARVKEIVTNICPYCNNKITSTKSGITFHINRCKENPNRKIHPGNCGHTIGYSAWNKGLTSSTDERIKQYSNKRKENYINGKWTRNWHKWTDEEKKNLSLKQKQYLINNPDKHVWKRNNKFISKPCEDLKEKLKENNILFEEEYCPFNDYAFSIDIAWPNLKIGVEVNGNQHYNNDGSLKEYYQNRHNIFEERGWKLYEIHYTKCYNNETIKNIMNILNIH